VGTPPNRKVPEVSTGDATGVPDTLTFVVGMPAALDVPVPAAKTVPVIVAPPAPEGDDGESPLQPTLTRMATNDVAIRLGVIASGEANPRPLSSVCDRERSADDRRGFLRIDGSRESFRALVLRRGAMVRRLLSS
jgi:hypothetical protein